MNKAQWIALAVCFLSLAQHFASMGASTIPMSTQSKVNVLATERQIIRPDA